MNIYESLCTCCDALKQQQQQPRWFRLRSQRAAVGVCVAAGVNYRKWFLLGVWRPLALVISIHANTFPSLCASHAACFCGAHTHAHHTHIYNHALHALHTHAWFFAFTIFNIFFPGVTQPGTIPLRLICMCVLVCLARVMTCVTGVGSYRGRQSHGRDTSLCVSNNLFVVGHKHTHTKKSTAKTCSFTGC